MAREVALRPQAGDHARLDRGWSPHGRSRWADRSSLRGLTPLGSRGPERQIRSADRGHETPARPESGDQNDVGLRQRVGMARHGCRDDPVLALVILGVIFLARYLGGARDRRDFGINGGRSDAERILANRFARGEIDEEEYRKRRELIRGGGR